MTGRRRRDVQRSGLKALFRDPAELELLIADLEERGRVVDRELVLVRHGGDELPVRVYGTCLKPETRTGAAPRGRRHKRAGGRGKAVNPDTDRYLIVIHDMTEVHHIRRRLIETEKLSAMAKIAGSVAHEFRNPLNSLFLNTDLLEDELEGKADIREAIQPTLLAIREEIERLNQIITHYLSLSKIASSTPETLDLATLVDDFAEEWQPRAEERGFVLKTRADTVTHPISADPNQVRRVMVNLVENAFDALDARQEGETGRARTGRVTLILRRMRRSVKLTVKDNGPGIPADVRGRVFEPFFTSKSGGSGLGLYLVREIVLAAGGSMSLSSADGRGTSVSVRWPLVEESTTQRGAA